VSRRRAASSADGSTELRTERTWRVAFAAAITSALPLAIALAAFVVAL
jgi:hypothetical protein